MTSRYPIWREAFINDADEALAKSSYDSLSPEPYQPHLDRPNLERFYATRIPKSYLNGTEDHALPPWPLPARSDARQPRSDLYKSWRPRGELDRGRARLD